MELYILQRGDISVRNIKNIKHKGYTGNLLHWLLKTNDNEFTDADVELMKYLVDNGCDAEALDTYNFSPLAKTITQGFVPLDCLQMLIDSGLDVTEPVNEEGWTPLMYAVQYDIDYSSTMKAKLDLILAQGPDVNAKTIKGNTPLHSCVSRDRYGSITELLIEKGAEVNAKTDESKTPLHEAVLHGRKQAAIVLIQNGADVNSVDMKGFTPLLYAAKRILWGEDTKQLIELLINKGAEINITDKNGNTPLHHAAIHANLYAIELLLKNGAYVNTINENGDTPLHLVTGKETSYVRLEHSLSYSWRENIAQMIIEQEGNPNVKNNKGDLALHDAIHLCSDPRIVKKKPYIRLVKVLAAVTDLNIKNNEGFTPYDLAQESYLEQEIKESLKPN